MKIRYIGSEDPSEDTTTTAFGSTFVQGEWVELPAGAEALATNPMFEVKAPRSKGGAEAVADTEVPPQD